MSCSQDLQTSKKHLQVSQASRSRIKSKTWVWVSGSNIPVMKDGARDFFSLTHNSCTATLRDWYYCHYLAEEKS